MDIKDKYLLEVQNLKEVFYTEKDEVEALKNITFNVKKGEIVSLLGPSGCGKTTILSILSGLLKETDGYFKINDVNKDIGYMFQNDTLFEWRTIEENCFLPLEIKGLENEIYINYVRKLLKDFGLWDFKDKYPKSLSGGMRQRVALIRSLATKPDILLLDEPFSALDYQTKIKLSQDIFNSIKQLNKTAIFVTHNIQEAISLSDKIVMLSKRPTVVKKEIFINFENNKKRNIALITKEEKYNEYFEEVWNEVMSYGN